MAKADIFVNQTTDLVVELVDGNPIYVEGTPQIDISGTLDGATMRTEYLHSNNSTSAWITSVDGTWFGTADPVPVLPDGALVALNKRQVRFSIENAGASTDISVSLSY